MTSRMNASMMLEILEPVVGPGVITVGSATDHPTLIVSHEHWLAVARALRDHPQLRMTLLSDVIGVDYLPREPRFEVVYHVASPDLGQRARVKVAVPGVNPELPTVSDVWTAANWLEREVWDLFGIVFGGHPDLTRLLMPDDWEGHPLRKDFPVQIDKPVSVYEPLQVSEQEFKARIEADRRARR